MLGDEGEVLLLYLTYVTVLYMKPHTPLTV